MEILVQVATAEHRGYAPAISGMIKAAAHSRGTGIAHRSPEHIRSKIEDGLAVIALAGEGREAAVAGFCYLGAWGNGKYVASSGLIVDERFRQQGVAQRLKETAVRLSRQKFPGTTLFSITTASAVMKINSDLGFRPVTFSELPADEAFWNQCRSCPNYDILMRNQRRNCLCTAMLMNPARAHQNTSERIMSPLNHTLGFPSMC